MKLPVGFYIVLFYILGSLVLTPNTSPAPTSIIRTEISTSAQNQFCIIRT